MFQKFAVSSLMLAVCFLSSSAVAQTSLSQNSGINSADTWVTLDLTTQVQNVTMTLARPIYNPATGTTTSILSPTPPPHHVPCRSWLRCEWRACDESLAKWNPVESVHDWNQCHAVRRRTVDHI